MTEVPASGAARLFGAIAASALLMLLVVSASSSRWISQEVTGLVTWIAGEGRYGQVVFLSVLVIVCLTGIIPASMLAMAAGTLYGFGKGAVLSSIGLSIGGMVGFLA